MKQRFEGICPRAIVLILFLGLALNLGGCRNLEDSGSASVVQILSEGGGEQPKEIRAEELSPAEGYDNLYILEESMPDGMAYVGLEPFGDNILLVGEQYDMDNDYELRYYFCVYDPWKREIAASLTADEVGSASYHVAGDRLLLYDPDDHKITLYDQTLTATAVGDLSEVMEEQDGTFFSGDSLFPLYIGESVNNKLWKVVEKEGVLSVKKLNPPLSSASVSGVTADGSGLILTGIEQKNLKYKTILWDTDTQEILAEADIPSSYGYFYGAAYDRHILQEIDSEKGIWLNQVLGQEAGYLELTGYPIALLPEEDRIALILDESSDEEVNLRFSLYDEKGGYLSGIDYYCGNYMTDTYFCFAYSTFPLKDTGWYVLLRYDLLGKTTLMLWDTSAEGISGENLEAIDPQVVEVSAENPEHEETALEELYERAAELSESSGMRIRIGEDVPDEVDVYHIAREADPQVVSDALDTLENIFSCYPEDFFEELCFNHISGITIYLGGEITSDAEGMLQEAGGFVCEEGSEMIMALNTSFYFDWNYTVNHEISHMIDRRLNFRQIYVEGTMFSEETWNTYNPDGFMYLDTYAGYEDNPDYQRYPEYFIDSYGLTFATEDRAEIFGKAMESYLNGYDETDVFEEDGYITRKLAYYCECIRNGFSSGDWPVQMPWEQALENG